MDLIVQLAKMYQSAVPVHPEHTVMDITDASLAQQGGFYQDDFGHLNCKNCPAGVFVNHTGGTSISDCALCPEGTDLSRHAGNRACFCKINYARINRFEGCSLCLERGLNCSKDYKSVQPGFYWNWSFPGANVAEYSNFAFYLQNDSLFYNYSNSQYRFKIPKIHECPQPLSCENKVSFKAGRIQGNCKDGYRGWLCSKCQVGFYSVLNTCIPCPDKKWIFLEMVAILMFGVGSYVFIYWQNKKQEDDDRRQRSLFDKISSQTKIVLGFYQVVGELFESFHDVTWIGPLEFVGQVIAFLKVNVLRVIIRPRCYSEKLHMNAKVQFIISLSFPIAMFVVLVFLYQFWRLYLKYRVRATIDCRIAKLRKLKEKLFTCAVILLFVTYPPTCDVVFKLYPGACKTFYIYENETTVNITLLRSDFDLECTTLKIYQIFAYIATGVYVIAFPCVLLFLMGRYSRKGATARLHGHHSDNTDSMPNVALDERAVLINVNCDQVIIPVWLKFLSENYKPQFWYWEIIELTRKVTQTVLVTLLGWEDALTKLLTIGTAVLFLTLHAKLSPMTSQFEQRLQMFSLTAIFINVLVASVPIPHDYTAPISTIIILMNMIIVFVIVGEVTIFTARFLRQKLRQRKLQ
ncbi:hypothetical protein HOLleu_02141 [Holothuria leucospilota]|uniref:Tyrosine-protein kinase ephrin type A/B receptor-like domain-containing protein n=1 Tax=Holothuria leucospilota TaxID=206669 RepID=A0A9Q1CPW8_HOLLE|nr:hypothetical protein HOLleu_02141 [Holothuria leucospilota]